MRIITHSRKIACVDQRRHITVYVWRSAIYTLVTFLCKERRKKFFLFSKAKQKKVEIRFQRKSYAFLGMSPVIYAIDA